MKTFIIAEAGVNHNGREDLALDMVDQAAACGADAVKFQTFAANKLVRPGTATADYQKRETGTDDQHALLKALEISADLHERLFARCEDLGIEFMSTPFDEEAASFLVGLGMRRIKVPSGEITNEPFLAYLARLGPPLILSTGMADMDEIHRAVEVIERTRRDAGLSGSMHDCVTILHCTSNYPAANSEVNLRAMQTIAASTGLPVGYSDHTLGIAVSTAAVALGARVIEKHFTLDRTASGPDHSASLTVDELAAMIAQIRAVEEAMGSPVKRPTAAELPVRALVRRSVTANRNLTSGTTITLDDVILLRPGGGIPPAERDLVIGRTLVRNVEVGEAIRWSDLE